MNFLTYTGFQASVGISHQKSNLTAMLKEAALSGRELIVPHFHLTGAHNRGRPLVSQLAEYFDFSDVAVAGVAVAISTHLPREGSAAATRVAMSESLIGRMERLIVKDAAGEGLLRLPLEAVYRGFAALPVRLPTHPALTGLAAALAPQIPAHAAWVHVRRGDVLHRTGAGTSPENIRRVLQAVAPATQALYLAPPTNATPASSRPSPSFTVLCSWRTSRPSKPWARKTITNSSSPSRLWGRSFPRASPRFGPRAIISMDRSAIFRAGNDPARDWKRFLKNKLTGGGCPMALLKPMKTFTLGTIQHR